MSPRDDVVTAVRERLADAQDAQGRADRSGSDTLGHLVRERARKEVERWRAALKYAEGLK